MDALRLGSALEAQLLHQDAERMWEATPVLLREALACAWGGSLGGGRAAPTLSPHAACAWVRPSELWESRFNGWESHCCAHVSSHPSHPMLLPI